MALILKHLIIKRNKFGANEDPSTQLTRTDSHFYDYLKRLVKNNKCRTIGILYFEHKPCGICHLYYVVALFKLSLATNLCTGCFANLSDEFVMLLFNLFRGEGSISSTILEGVSHRFLTSTELLIASIHIKQGSRI